MPPGPVPVAARQGTRTALCPQRGRAPRQKLRPETPEHRSPGPAAAEAAERRPSSPLQQPRAPSKEQAAVPLPGDPSRVRRRESPSGGEAPETPTSRPGAPPGKRARQEKASDSTVKLSVLPPHPEPRERQLPRRATGTAGSRSPVCFSRIPAAIFLRRQPGLGAAPRPPPRTQPPDDVAARRAARGGSRSPAATPRPCPGNAGEPSSPPRAASPAAAAAQLRALPAPGAVVPHGSQQLQNQPSFLREL